MEGANHCYEIEMTSNYLLAANVHVCQLLCHVPPLSFFFLCLFVVVAMMNLSGRSKMQPSFLFLNVETEKIGVVKQSLCHIGNGSCLQWVISGAFYKLTAFSSEALQVFRCGLLKIRSQWLKYGMICNSVFAHIFFLLTFDPFCVGWQGCDCLVTRTL